MLREALTFEAMNKLGPEEAAALFVARRAEGLTESEKQLLAGWLAGNERNRRAFDNAAQAWRIFDDSEGNEFLVAMRAHALSQRRDGRARWRQVAVIGASIAAACIVIALLFPGLEPQVPPGAEIQEIQYVAARGQVREIQLPDGSSMTLDAESAAVGRFGEQEREIALNRGRAYFAVRFDQARPFEVTAAGRRVVVTGTRFDVSIAASGLTVTLLEGNIDIGPEDGSQALQSMSAGQQYVSYGGQRTIRAVGAAGEDVISWRMGLVHFDDQRLDEAAAVMNRYAEDQIVIRDSTIAALRISGQFRAGETQRFADTLAELQNLRAVRRDNQIELVRP